MLELETTTPGGRLIREIALYLEAVDAFRAVGCDPWGSAVPSPPRVTRRVATSNLTTTKRRIPPPRFTV